MAGAPAERSRISATPIDQSKTVNGRTVTVERAYVDATVILVGVTLRDRSGEPAGVGQLEVHVDGVGVAQSLGDPETRIASSRPRCSPSSRLAAWVTT